jgi:hypothetical protein
LNLSSEQKQNESVKMWAWLLPAVYACHVAEEAFGGYGLMEWMAAEGGVRFTLGAFLRINLIGVSLLCLAAWAARKWRAWQWPLVSGAAIILINGVWHAILCVTTRSYVPGVWTGLFLYVPLGVFLLARMRPFLSLWLFVSAIGFGLVIHRATLWLVLRIPGLDL